MLEPLGPPGGFWLLSIDQPDRPITDEFGFTSREEKCSHPDDSLPPTDFLNPTSIHGGMEH